MGCFKTSRRVSQQVFQNGTQSDQDQQQQPNPLLSTPRILRAQGQTEPGFRGKPSNISYRDPVVPSQKVRLDPQNLHKSVSFFTVPGEGTKTHP